VDGEHFAESLVRHARQEFAHCDNLSFIVASARNSGGDIFVM
jgi:hypothetical protein